MGAADPQANHQEKIQASTKEIPHQLLEQLRMAQATDGSPEEIRR
jgi:hypothetical protein